MSDLLIRAVSGALFVGLMVGCIWHSFLATAILFALLVVVGLKEFYKLSDNLPNIKSNKNVGIALGAYSFVTGFLFLNGTLDYRWVLLSLVLLMLALLSELFRNTAQPLFNSALLVFGLLYVVVPFFVMLLLRGVGEDTEQWMYL